MRVKIASFDRWIPRGSSRVGGPSPGPFATLNSAAVTGRARWAALWLILAGGALSAPAQQACGQEAWEYSPYRLQVLRAVAPAPELPPKLVERVMRTIQLRSDAVAGAAWRLEINAAPQRLDHDINHALDKIDFYQLTGFPEPDPDSETSSSSARRKREAGEEGDGAQDEQLDEGEALLGHDKVYLLGLSFELNRYVVRIREFDCATRLWSPMLRREVAQVEMLDEAAFDTLLAAFTPMVRIEDAEEKVATTRLRAGNLIVADESIANIRPGDVLLPVIRRNNRYGDPLLGGIEAIPWTFLTVEQRDGALLNCQVHSGIRRPISGRNSVRTQRYGLLARPKGTTTELVLMSKDVPPKPMVGYDVYSKYPAEEEEDRRREAEARAAAQAAAEKAAAEQQAALDADAGGDPTTAGTTSPADPPAGEEPPAEAAPTSDPALIVAKENPPVFLGRSDWRGMVEVPPGDFPVRLVYVKNGGRLLARLPIVPGLEPLLQVDLMNDDLRLEAEAFIAGVRSKIMDLVARRAVLSARIRGRIQENKLAEAEEMMAELRGLESRRDISGMLDQQQQRFATVDRVMQRKIDILFSDTRELIGKFLKDDDVDKLAQEIRAGQGAGS